MQDERVPMPHSSAEYAPFGDSDDPDAEPWSPEPEVEVGLKPVKAMDAAAHQAHKLLGGTEDLPAETRVLYDALAKEHKLFDLLYQAMLGAATRAVAGVESGQGTSDDWETFEALSGAMNASTKRLGEVATTAAMIRIYAEGARVSR